MLDGVFRPGDVEYIEKRSALNDCTWSYMFDYDFPIDGGHPAWHCADIPYFFHNTDLVPVTQEPGVGKKLEWEMFGAPMSFAYTGNPNHKDIPKWSPSKPGQESVMVFGKETKVKENYDHRLMELVKEYIKPSLAQFMDEHKDEIQH